MSVLGGDGSLDIRDSMREREDEHSVWHPGGAIRRTSTTIWEKSSLTAISEGAIEGLCEGEKSCFREGSRRFSIKDIKENIKDWREKGSDPVHLSSSSG